MTGYLEHKVVYTEKQTEKEGNVTELFGGRKETSAEKKPKTTESERMRDHKKWEKLLKGRNEYGTEIKKTEKEQIGVGGVKSREEKPRSICERHQELSLSVGEKNKEQKWGKPEKKNYFGNKDSDKVVRTKRDSCHLI